MYYVYRHIDDDGSIVYIGKGKWDRAWVSSKRDEPHKTWMRNHLPNLNVDFVATGMDELNALELERALIKEFQPRFNKFYTKRDSARLKDQGVWLAKEKSRFNDSSLQKELGIRAASSGKHPNNRLISCSRCGVSMNIGHIKRYHNDNCKRRAELNELS